MRKIITIPLALIYWTLFVLGLLSLVLGVLVVAIRNKVEGC